MYQLELCRVMCLCHALNPRGYVGLAGALATAPDIIVSGGNQVGAFWHLAGVFVPKGVFGSA